MSVPFIAIPVELVELVQEVVHACRADSDGGRRVTREEWAIIVQRLEQLAGDAAKLLEQR